MCQQGGGAFGFFFFHWSAGDDADVPDVDAQQGKAVNPGQRTLERNKQGVQGCQAEKEHVCAFVGGQGYARVKLARKHKHNGRPAHAYEQPVGPGHIGNGVVRIRALGVLACHPGKVHVHGVFGQHGNKGHHRHGNSLGNVHLGNLAGPGEQKRSTQNGHARKYSHQQGRNIGMEKTYADPGQGHAHSNNVRAQSAKCHMVSLK